MVIAQQGKSCIKTLFPLGLETLSPNSIYLATIPLRLSLSVVQPSAFPSDRASLPFIRRVSGLFVGHSFRPLVSLPTLVVVIRVCPLVGLTFVVAVGHEPLW